MLKNYKVQLSDIDIVNHANSVKYLEWCLNAVDPKYILRQKIKGFQMNFLRELSLNDEVIIAQKEHTIVVSKSDKICFALELNE